MMIDVISVVVATVAELSHSRADVSHLVSLACEVMLLRSVGHLADRQEFLYQGRDVGKSITNL